jgi:hypothetical protein
MPMIAAATLFGVQWLYSLLNDHEADDETLHHINGRLLWLAGY